MKVSSISYPNSYNHVYFGAKSNNSGTSHKNTKKHKPSAIHESMMTAASWFGFGVVLDLISRRFSFFKSPFKNSVAVNGIIGACAGLITGCKFLFSKKNDED